MSAASIERPGESMTRVLAEERMNRTASLPDCTCLAQPRIVSYSEVGDPEGWAAFMILGVDSHRYLAALFDDAAKARGAKLICLDRPGRGKTSDYADERANRVLEFPQILRAFCGLKGISSFALLGQSLGATYALRCAQEMPDMIATTVYLVSPWVPLSVPGTSRTVGIVEGLPRWFVKGALAVGTAVPRLVSSVRPKAGLALLARGCSDDEAALFKSSKTAEVLTTVNSLDEPSHGFVLDILTALEKERPLGFDYRDVSMPVHVFHGRADHMVPFAAAQWMAEEMPACTVSVKMGGTHALIMDRGVLGCIFDCMSEDFRHFREQKRDGGPGDDGKAAQGPAFSFPAHTQSFQAKGHLLIRHGLLRKLWEPRYFILEGYQLHELRSVDSATALRVVDLRGSIARVPDTSIPGRAVGDVTNKAFSFRLEDNTGKQLYELGADSAGERAGWIETLTKASRYSTADEKRQGALRRQSLVSTSRNNSVGVVDARLRTGAENTAGRSNSARTKSLSRSRRSSYMSPPGVDDSSSRPEPWAPSDQSDRAPTDAGGRSFTPGNGSNRRKNSRAREILHGTPFRSRKSLGSETCNDR